MATGTIDKFSLDFRDAVVAAAHKAELLATPNAHRMVWVEEPGTTPAGSRGWWVCANLRPRYDLDQDSAATVSGLLASVTVTSSSGRDDDSPASETLLDVEVRGTGAHLVVPLAALAVSVITSYLHDRDTRIAMLRERKGTLAAELEAVTAELSELDGIADDRNDDDRNDDDRNEYEFNV
jgi:hypothetical protein